MLKNNKTPCTNVSTESYTGKEQSPKRFGLSAEGFDINYQKEGFDNQIWTVQIKNSRKVWVRNSTIAKITHEEPILITNNIPSNTINDTLESSNNNDTDIIESSNIQQSNTNVKLKTKTDYNIFLSYYQNKLKLDNKEKKTAKELFNQSIAEWKRLKEHPIELKELLEFIKNK